MEERKLELFIPGELKDEEILCQIIRNFDISLKIVEASFSTESGWAYLIIGGKKSEITKMNDFLKEKGIKVKLPVPYNPASIASAGQISFSPKDLKKKASWDTDLSFLLVTVTILRYETEMYYSTFTAPFEGFKKLSFKLSLSLK